MIRTAIVGAGGIAELHVSAMKRLDARPAAVIAETEDEARAFAVRHGIPRWGTELELISDPAIDAVHLCTPPSTHSGLIRFCLDQGKHIYCEKPLCLDADEAAVLAEAARERGSVCAVGFNVRFYPACLALRARIRSGDFGRPLLIHGDYLQSFHALPARYQWRYDPAIGGPMRAVTEIGSHWLDLARFITGLEITAVSARLGRFFPKRRIGPDGMMSPEDESGEGEVIQVESEDAAIIHLQFGEGTIGSVVLSEVSPGRENRLTIEATCERGNFWWNSEANGVLSVSRKGGPIQTESFGFGEGFGDTFYSSIGLFYRTVLSPERRDGSARLPTFDDGAENAAVCAAILESDRRGSEWVAVRGAGRS